MNRPNTLAEVARRVSAGAAFGPTLSEFLDEFYMNPERRAAMITDEPPRLPDARTNALRAQSANIWLGAGISPACRRGQTTLRAFCTNRISRRRLKSSRRCCSRKVLSLFAAA
jgi:hypothetical protein